MYYKMVPKVREIIDREENQAGSEVSETGKQTGGQTERVNSLLEEEEYRLRITADDILLEGGSEQGLRYARQTLRQIRGQMGDQGGAKALPGAGMLELSDAPAYPYRSFHIDCARHFVPVEELKKMIRTAACFKFNRFHWHFSDDQGWRIESRAFPRLHEIGSVRKGDHFGNYCSEEPEAAFYTIEEVRDLVSYCEELGIEIVPEIDMPGHVTAILAAYPQLSCWGEAVEVADRAGIFYDILCPGKEETFSFLERLLEELIDLFPGRYFHIGGDEAPKEHWKTCPHCQKRIREQGLESVQELQGYLMNRIAAYLKDRGRRAIAWNEAANGGNLDPDIILQVWTEDKAGQVRPHTERGGQVIVSPIMHSYCDYPYGFITLQSVYEIPLAAQEYPQEAVLGGECLLWTEYIRTGERLEELAWPRFAATAEALWCGARRGGYEAFAERLRGVIFLFKENGIRATPESGWIPSEEEKLRQFAAFKQNFMPEVIADFRKAQEDV
ncbi:MAG: beta-N-acetylhexosaminidase [Eubacteriales bacterium]|nr:beta-N-acetylhexosaminidase [Eubacteriales bacterium]